MRCWLLFVLVSGCSPEAATEAPDTDVPADASLDASTDAVVADAPAEAATEVGKDATADVDAGPALDPDGVLMLHPTKPGGQAWRLGTDDPNKAADLEIEQKTVATKVTEGKLTFWNVLSHALTYASGGDGWTSRLHLYNSKTRTQLYTWKTQKGWLATPEDLHDQEVTIYLRGHGVLDAPRLAFTLKIRGGYHTSKDPDQGSCTMMVFAGKATSGVTRFGKELIHPQYDYVKLTPTIDTSLVDNTWVGLKLVSLTVDTTKIRYELWIDRDPWDAATGLPKNGWTKLSEYVDTAGTSTGKYTLLADWGGLITTVRTDGWRDIDFTKYSVREVLP